MTISHGNITLRNIEDKDIADYERWAFTETEWLDWDAPWENDDMSNFVTRQRGSLLKTPEVYYKLEIEDEAGRHIGWVSAYEIDDLYDLKGGLAVGISIPPIGARGKGLGENALRAFIRYLFDATKSDVLYTQTWSGNFPMLRLAEKLGFRMVRRIEKCRHVRGENYDALTFVLSRDEPKISITLNGIGMAFVTSPALFSPHGLDAGTRAMLSLAEFRHRDKVLDLGCGWGVVGVYAAKQVGGTNVTMCDIDETAVAISRENAALNGVPGVRVIHGDGFANIPDAGYTLILSNPPFHADFSVAKAFIEKGFNRLAIGGKMMMVTKRRDWYKNKLIAVFGGVKINEVDGYFVFTAEKRSGKYANK